MSDYEYRQDDDYEGNKYDSYYNENTAAEQYSADTGSDDQYAKADAADQYSEARSGRYSYVADEAVRSNRKGRKDKKESNWFTGALKVAGFALIFGLVSGSAFTGVKVAGDHLFPSGSNRIETTTANDDTEEKNSTNTTTTINGDGTAALSQDVSAVVDKVMPSVVSVTGTYRTADYFGFGSQESEGAGSGFLIAEDDNRLLIATNNHVVADSTSLTVGFVDNTTAAATVVGKDSNADLAVISVNKKDLSADTAKKIKIATLGDSEKLKVGESVIVIGNAMGYGQSATMGILSAKDREVSFTDGTMTLLQTDAAINPGNSGGVLINLKGEVVGISNAKLVDTQVESMCYAIPITTANAVLTDLMNAGEISKENASYLGIRGKNIDANYSQALGMPQGIYVAQVISGSPAEKAGISAGDIITALDGNNVSTMAGLKEKLAIKKAGTEIKVTLKRASQSGEYKEKTIKVTLGKASDFQDAAEDNQSQNDDSQNQNGGNGTNGGDGWNGNGGNGQNGNGNGWGDDSDDYYNNGGSNDPFYYFFNR